MEIQPGESIILLELIFETNQSLVEIETYGAVLKKNTRDKAALRNLIRPLRSIQGNAILLHTPFLAELADLTLQIVEHNKDVETGLVEADAVQLFQGIEGMKFLLEICNSRLTAALQGRKAPDTVYADEIEQYVAGLKSVLENRGDAALELIKPAAVSEAQKVKAGAERQASEEYGSPVLVHVNLEDLEQIERRLRALAALMNGETQREILALAGNVALMSTISLGKLLDRLKHFTANFAETSGKKIRFEIRGEIPRVKKPQFDTLSETLAHLIQNALDHGLESPRERALAEKETEARLCVEFHNEAECMQLVIADDGRGIDRGRLEQSAQRKTGRPLAELQALELLDLVCLAGVSTAKETSESSGRGMGMKIAVDNLRRIGAQIELKTEAGAGTRFILRVPRHDA